MGLIDSIQFILSRPSLADEVYYEAVSYELSAGIIRRGLWAMSLAEQKWDEPRAKARYLQLRVNALKNEVAAVLRKEQDEQQLRFQRKLELDQENQLQVVAQHQSMLHAEKLCESEALVAHQKGDYKKAFAGFSALAHAGKPLGQNYLGYMYEFGQGTARDIDLAVEWYRKAADSDNCDAQYHLGRICLTSLQDYDAAIRWFSLAEKNGHSDARQKRKDAIEYQKAKIKQEAEFEAARRRLLKGAWVKRSDYAS